MQENTRHSIIKPIMSRNVALIGSSCKSIKLTLKNGLFTDVKSRHKSGMKGRAI